MAEPHEHRKMSEQTEVIAQCDRFEAELAELRAAYDQYFLGLEKRPPVDRHAQLKRQLLKLRGQWVRQTAARFRVQAAAQKFATYERLWQRSIQELENGTHRRDVARWKRRHAPGKGELNHPTDDPPSSPASPRKADPGPPAQDGMVPVLSDQTLRAVYEAFLSARKRCNEDVSRVSFEQVAQTLRKQVPDLMKKHNAKTVELRVVIKEGKAVLQVIPKEG
jgi:hypothetical protein